MDVCVWGACMHILLSYMMDATKFAGISYSYNYNNTHTNSNGERYKRVS